MAFELYGMLAGNVSPMTGENVKPAYGGDDEAFLRKVITPIYNVIAKVLCAIPSQGVIYSSAAASFLLYLLRCYYCFALQEAERSKKGRSKHSQWRNYDDLNEYFW